MPGPCPLSQPAMHARTLAHESGGSNLQWGHVYDHVDEGTGKLWLWLSATHAVELPGFAERIEITLQSSMISIAAQEFIQHGTSWFIDKVRDEVMDVSVVPVEADGSLPSSSSSGTQQQEDEPSSKRRKMS